MKTSLKKLSDQVIVITGATSGIGLATARMAARRGAKLVLAARNEDALKQLSHELAAAGCQAVYAVADVGVEEDVRRIADVALERFGGFDTWINNAGISIFGRTEDVPLEDHKRLFQTNFWGVVHGSLVALEHLKRRGGALINVGSEVSDHALPVQNTYAASKHAVKGFTEGLRVELANEKAPVSVTLIKPAAIDTMFVPHARNYLQVEPQLPPPLYAPEVVAEAILFAAEHPRRDLFVGGAAQVASVSARYAPRVFDRMLRFVMAPMQKTSRPAKPHDKESLYHSRSDLRERQGQSGHVAESSLYTRASMHRKTVMACGVGALALLSVWRRRQQDSRLKAAH